MSRLHRSGSRASFCAAVDQHRYRPQAVVRLERSRALQRRKTSWDRPGGFRTGAATPPWISPSPRSLLSATWPQTTFAGS